MNRFFPGTQRVSILLPADSGVLLVFVGAVFAGLRPLFARMLIDDGITAIVIALYCYLGSAVLFLPTGIKGLQAGVSQKRAALLAVACGLMVGIGGAAYFEALRRLSVATVTLIYFTYPAWVVILMAIFQRRWPRRSAWIGTGCVLAGIYLIIGHGIHNPDNTAVDFLIAWLAPLSWTVLLVFLGGPLTVLKPYARIGFITLGAVLTMGLAVLLQQPAALLAQSGSGWAAALCMLLICGIACHVVTTIGVQKAGSERSSFAGAFEIVTSLVIGWLIFSEPISFSQAAGVVLILTAVLSTRRIEVGFSAGRRLA